MTGNGNDGRFGSTLVMWLLVGLVAIVALKLILRLAGLVVGVTLWAVLTLGPILLLGWLVLKGLRYFSRQPGYPEG